MSPLIFVAIRSFIRLLIQYRIGGRLSLENGGFAGSMANCLQHSEAWLGRYLGFFANDLS